jgi:hypothetical protein
MGQQFWPTMLVGCMLTKVIKEHPPFLIGWLVAQDNCNLSNSAHLLGFTRRCTVTRTSVRVGTITPMLPNGGSALLDPARNACQRDLQCCQQ